MNILLVAPLPPPEGGMSTWTCGITKFFQNKKINYSVINTAVHGKRKKNINLSVSFVDEICRSFYIMISFFKELLKRKFDLVHINSSCGRLGIYRDCFLCILSRFRGNKVIVQYHCDIEDNINNWLAGKVLHLMLILSNKNIVLNQRSFNYVKKTFGVKKLEVVPNFLDITFDKQFVVRENIKNVTYVGHVKKTKGIDEIIAIANKNANITFKIIGPISDEYRGVAMPNNIVMMGNMAHNSIFEELVNSDLFLFLSHSEGFSIALLEAMSVGMPILATDVGANSDMIEGHGGIIVKVGDTENIQLAIKTMKNKTIRQYMSSWNKNKVISNYTLEIVGKKILYIYNNI